MAMGKGLKGSELDGTENRFCPGCSAYFHLEDMRYGCCPACGDRAVNVKRIEVHGPIGFYSNKFAAVTKLVDVVTK